MNNTLSSNVYDNQVNAYYGGSYTDNTTNMWPGTSYNACLHCGVLITPYQMHTCQPLWSPNIVQPLVQHIVPMPNIQWLPEPDPEVDVLWTIAAKLDGMLEEMHELLTMVEELVDNEQDEEVCRHPQGTGADTNSQRVAGAACTEEAQQVKAPAPKGDWHWPPRS